MDDQLKTARESMNEICDGILNINHSLNHKIVSVNIREDIFNNMCCRLTGPCPIDFGHGYGAFMEASIMGFPIHILMQLRGTPKYQIITEVK